MLHEFMTENAMERLWRVGGGGGSLCFFLLPAKCYYFIPDLVGLFLWAYLWGKCPAWKTPVGANSIRKFLGMLRIQWFISAEVRHALARRVIKFGGSLGTMSLYLSSSFQLYPSFFSLRKLVRIRGRTGLFKRNTHHIAPNVFFLILKLKSLSLRTV